MRRLALVVAATAAPLASCQTMAPVLDAAVPSAALQGRWVSQACAPVDNADGTTSYVRTELTVGAQDWARDEVHHSDDACTDRIGTIHSTGTWKATALSKTVPGAIELSVELGARTATAHVDGFIAFLQSMSCGQAPYAVDVAQDLGASGCTALGVHAQGECPVIFDLVTAAPGELRIGSASGEACDAGTRPTSTNVVFVSAR